MSALRRCRCFCCLLLLAVGEMVARRSGPAAVADREGDLGLPRELSAVKDQIEELMGFGESNPAKSEELLRVSSS